MGLRPAMPRSVVHSLQMPPEFDVRSTMHRRPHLQHHLPQLSKYRTP
jgi:hypothetical protein